MAVILAAVNLGNWSDPATWVGGVVPGPGDVVMANGIIVLVDIDATVAEIRNDTTGGATAGGRISLYGVTITADVYAGGTAVTPGLFSATGNRSCILIGNVYAGTGCNGAGNSGTGTLTIIGTVHGNGYGPGSTGITAGIYGASNTWTGLLRVLRTVQGARGMPAVNGPMQFIDSRHAEAKVRATAGLTEVTLKDVVGWTPDPADTLAGTSYEGRTGLMPVRAGSMRMHPMWTAGAAPNLIELTDEDGNPLTDEAGNILYGD